MPLPTYDLLMFPLLQLLAEQAEPLRAPDARARLAARLALPSAERALRLPSGKQAVFDNRVGWAHDRLKRAGLSESARRGHWQITEAGRAFLAAHPQGLSDAERAVLAIVNRESPTNDEVHPSDATATAAPVVLAPVEARSPRERIEEAFAELQDQLAQDLLAQVRAMAPERFETLVLDLLHAMGYGVSRRHLRQVGQSGDGGIDGVVNLDKLGLQKVYVQAKRWGAGNPVGRAEVQAFYGALAERRATYGVFITSSTFTANATRAAEKLSDTIVLLDGEGLVRAMIEHDVGVSTEQLFRLKRIDSDYFGD